MHSLKIKKNAYACLENLYISMCGHTTESELVSLVWICKHQVLLNKQLLFLLWQTDAAATDTTDTLTLYLIHGAVHFLGSSICNEPIQGTALAANWWNHSSVPRDQAAWGRGVGGGSQGKGHDVGDLIHWASQKITVHEIPTYEM